DGVVYISAGYGGEHHLYAYNAASGALLWTALANSGVPATVANGFVYVGGCAGLCAYDAATGALRWTAATANTVNSAPAIAYGVVYVGAESAGLYAFNAADGTLRWHANIFIDY